MITLKSLLVLIVLYIVLQIREWMLAGLLLIKEMRE
jgi:hypothetical protein